MYVYRIEHATCGHGPYNPCGNPDDTVYDYARTLGSEHTIPEIYKTHPNMYLDTCAPRDENNYCGFSSIEQLFAWFDGQFDNLESHGYIMCIYDSVDEFTWEGTYQTVFRMTISRKIDSMSLSDVKLLFS